MWENLITDAVKHFTVGRRNIPELLVTLWPSFPHYLEFAKDDRVKGIRLNSAMTSSDELDKELDIIKKNPVPTPLYFDVKGRQLRIEEVIPNTDHLDIRLNHPIEIETPCPILFKAGSDAAYLLRLEEDGKRLIFDGGPKFKVKVGESLHLRNDKSKVLGSIFSELEKAKIEKVKQFGFKKYFLSYVEKQSDIDEFEELVGKDCEIWLKIESKGGLNFVANSFKKKENLTLVAARGDLYVEVDKPHEIISALKLIAEKDTEACVGSRFFLSIVPGLSESLLMKVIEQVSVLKKSKEATENVADELRKIENALKIALSLNKDLLPSCSDFTELEWLRNIGYKRFMLCDEICLKQELLANAVGAFDAWKNDLK